MERKKVGLTLGALFLGVFVIGIFKDQVYDILMKNYTTAHELVLSWFPKLITIILIILLAKFILYILYSIFRKYFKYVGKEQEYISVKRVTKYVIWTLAIIGILSVFIGDVGVWLTSVGLVGFGLTFALQKPILNFVSWITIMINRTYTMGDRVEIGGQRGDVLDIQMMYTVMDGLLSNTDELSGKVITLPNELVLTSSITNFTKSGEYLWDELSVDITYESNWKKAEELLKQSAYKVVNKYVIKSTKQSSERQEDLKQRMHLLKKSHSEAESRHEKKLIEKRMDDLKEEHDTLEGNKEQAKEGRKKEPIVRVALMDSSVSLNVRYLAHYKSMRTMKSEINTLFLEKSLKTKDVEIAYPHLQIVNTRKK